MTCNHHPDAKGVHWTPMPLLSRNYNYDIYMCSCGVLINFMGNDGIYCDIDNERIDTIDASALRHIVEMVVSEAVKKMALTIRETTYSCVGQTLNEMNLKG